MNHLGVLLSKKRPILTNYFSLKNDNEKNNNIVAITFSDLDSILISKFFLFINEYENLSKSKELKNNNIDDIKTKYTCFYYNPPNYRIDLPSIYSLFLFQQVEVDNFYNTNSLVVSNIINDSKKNLERFSINAIDNTNFNTIYDKNSNLTMLQHLSLIMYILPKYPLKITPELYMHVKTMLLQYTKFIPINLVFEDWHDIEKKSDNYKFITLNTIPKN